MNHRDVLLVSGGSRGIGAAIVREAVNSGYAVCFSYLKDEAAAEMLIRELRAVGGNVHAISGDVAEPSFAGRFFTTAGVTLGPVTAVVNNAGITGPIGRFRDTTLETMQRCISTNVLGPMLMCHEATSRWEESGTQGRIVNISSIASTLGAPHEYVHYAATKAAIEALTIGLGKEVAALGIRVNAVAPGTIHTDIHAAAGEPGRPARVVSRVPAGRIGEPIEIAKAVLWLLSPDASYVNAAVLRVSGGL